MNIIFAEELKKELDDVKQFTHDYIEDSMSLIQHEAYYILKQKALRKFWKEKVGHKGSIELNVFCDELLTSYLLETMDDTNMEQMKNLIQKFKLGMQNFVLFDQQQTSNNNDTQSSNANANTNTTEQLYIDSYILAKISRFIYYKINNFQFVLEQIVKALEMNCIFLLPGFDFNTQVKLVVFLL